MKGTTMAEDETREENVADIDFSQIRTSIKIGGRMIEQILNGVHYGSPEVRLLLLDECDIILECRVCRSLFRALPNFVAHKRVYCKQAYIMTKPDLFSTLPEDDVVVVHPTAPEDDIQSTSDCVCHSEKTQEKSADQKVRETVSLINDGKLGQSEMYKLYSKAAEKVDAQKKSKKTLNVVLSRIASNPNAVRVSYQEHSAVEGILLSEQQQSTLQTDRVDFLSEQQQSTSQADQVALKIACHTKDVQTPRQYTFHDESVSPQKNSDVDSISDKEKSILFQIGGTNSNRQSLEDLSTGKEQSAAHGRTGLKQPSEKQEYGDKKLNAASEKMKLVGRTKDGNYTSSSILDISSLKCLQCNTKYSSRKTLLYHVQMRHSGLRTFFPCPYCANVFFYFWGLTRHLRVNHKKTPNQINKMRKILREAAFTKNVTKPCIQAKDQLEFTTEISSGDKIIVSASDKSKSVMKISTESESRKQETSVLSSKRSKKSSANGKVVTCKATVKHTSTHVKHTFARRYVPTSEEDSYPAKTYNLDKFPEERLEKSKKYSHQLSCDVCRKVFWKKSRLANHKKFCRPSQRFVASTVKDHPQKPACCLCGKVFLRKRHLDRHGLSCSERDRNKKNMPETASLKRVDPGVRNLGDKLGVSNFSCLLCNRTFEKKISLENHKRSCQKSADKKLETDGCNLPSVLDGNNSQFCKDEVKPQRQRQGGVSQSDLCCSKPSPSPRADQSDDDAVHVVEEIWIHKQPGRPSEKVKSNRIYVMEADTAGRLHCQDTKRLFAIVDEIKLECKKCGQEFTSISNLRRHAIRHLGWKRYKCKLCRFSSYNKSECNTHIVRTHSEKYRFTSTESLIVDLNKEASRIRSQKKLQTLSAQKESIDKDFHAKKTCRRKAPKEINTLESGKQTVVDPSRKFNISTRNSPRKFDTRPYQKFDSMSTLFTRKGYYPKPSHAASTDVPILYMTEGLEKKSESLDDLSATKREVGEENADKQSPDDSKTKTVYYPVSTVPSPSSKSPKQSEDLKDEDGLEKEITKGKKRVRSDGIGTPSKVLRSEKTIDDLNTQQLKKQPAAFDAKCTDFLAPWPRASEPMSVKEMFALIRRSPRAGTRGSGRRKSVGDTPVQHVAALCTNTGEKQEVRQSVGGSARSSPRTFEGKTKLCATLPRRSSPAGNTLSLSVRTSRPGVDWSQSTDKQASKSNELCGGAGDKDDLIKQI